jgi:hypothetical protein
MPSNDKILQEFDEMIKDFKGPISPSGKFWKLQREWLSHALSEKDKEWENRIEEAIKKVKAEYWEEEASNAMDMFINQLKKK